MSSRLVGLVGQSCTRSEEGHRTYTITWHVQTNDVLDGPAAVLSDWVLPNVGDTYSLGNDEDAWAFCTPELNIAPHPGVTERDPCIDWIITQTFTSKPTWRCQTFPIENPLLEPYQISGDFTHEQREAKVDRFGNILRHPNWQPIIGPQVEQKYSWPTVSIAFNSSTLPLSTYVLLINKVNDAPLWEHPARAVRFIDAKWERLLYGTCFYYFRTTYTFEFNLEGFDPKIPATGTVELREGGNKNNPRDFVKIQDLDDENLGAALTIDGYRVDPDVPGRTVPHIQQPQIAQQGNLLLLGIPSTIP
jgi:hypothetical protein